MKKFLFALPLIVVSVMWASWNKPVQNRSMVNKEEVISCMNSETIEAYLQEASKVKGLTIRRFLSSNTFLAPEVSIFFNCDLDVAL